MSWINGLRFAVGLIVVIAVAGALLVVVTQRTGSIVSSSAQIDAQSYPVGSDYAGVMVEQFVKPGDTVAKGDKLVTIQSTDLIRDQLQGVKLKSTDVIEFVGDGLLTIRSSVAGVVESMPLQSGAYVAAGADIATIDAVESLFITADYDLAAADFGRLAKGATASVQLADAATVTGTVTAVQVQTVNGQAVTELKITSPDLVYGRQGGLVAPGAPVTASVSLPGEDPVRSTVAVVAGWFGVRLGA